MPCFKYIFMAILITTFLPILLYGIFARSRLCKIVGGAPLLSVLLLFVVGYTVIIVRSFSPSWVLKQAFGDLPQNDIQVIEHDWQFESIHLKLQANEGDFRKLVSLGFHKGSKEYFQNSMSRQHTPPWFDPIDEGAAEFYDGKEFYIGPVFHASLAYDRAKGIAYFFALYDTD